MFGILNINKPPGLTSRAVVNRVEKLVGKRVKCGHAGTLDPLATGVLLVCIGKATRLVPEIHKYPKSYAGTFHLGQQSQTDDTEGELTAVPIPADLNYETLSAALPRFQGIIQQQPPVYSAVWINGERAYKAARRGKTVEMPLREVEVQSLTIAELKDDLLRLNVTCGTGTYIRSIGRDLARACGTSAVMSELTRTSIGPFQVADAVELDTLTSETLPESLQPPLQAVAHLPKFVATPEEIYSLTCGRVIENHQPTQPPEYLISSANDEHDSIEHRVSVVDEANNLVALAASSANQLIPKQVFVTTEHFADLRK